MYIMSNFTKIFGWVIFLTGVLIIFWTLYSSYNIFTGQAAMPEIFEIESKDLSQKGTSSGIEAQMEKIIGDQLKELIPMDTIPKLLNLSIWAILAGILIFGGAQVSNLGVKLIRK